MSTTPAEAPNDAVPEPRKYPRTFHFPFSPGTTSDDRIARDVPSLTSGRRVVVTEKLDGENTCLNEGGVFARSHGAPTRNPWASYLWETHSRLKGDLRSIELFGESLYAVHSIKYGSLSSYFFLFAVRDGERWLSWDEVVEYAEIVGIPTAPVLFDGIIEASELRPLVEGMVAGSSRLSARDSVAPASPIEGVVARLADSFGDDAFSTHVFKWVRKGHVQSGEHWARSWERAFLGHELEAMGWERASTWLAAPPGGSNAKSR
jgi:hypothetical protein